MKLSDPALAGVYSALRGMNSRKALLKAARYMMICR